MTTQYLVDVETTDHGYIVEVPDLNYGWLFQGDAKDIPESAIRTIETLENQKDVTIRLNWVNS